MASTEPFGLSTDFCEAVTTVYVESAVGPNL